MDLHSGPRAIGFYGDSGSGKTTLIERLIEHFHGAGLRVAAVKHAHHGFDIDRPGKDSHRFREAGAAQVLIASDRRWALLSEIERPGPADAAAQIPLAALLARFDPCDLVLVEGYRGQAGIPFIEVRRTRIAGTRALAPRAGAPVAGLAAIAADEVLPQAGHAGIPVLDLNDIGAIAGFIVERLKLEVPR